MESVVYFSPCGVQDREQCLEAFRVLLREVMPPLRKGGLVGIKVHVGETPRSFLGPELAAEAVRMVKRAGAKPFLTDTCVLYKSRRDNAVDHTLLAQEHGYGPERVGAPFLVADGLVGTDEEMVSVPGAGQVAVAAMARRASGFIVLAHATGHLVTGFGGAIKSLGMGLASRKGKLAMHSVAKPSVRTSRCTACGECARWCPQDAITVEHAASIDHSSCVGCGECVAVCRYGAVGFDWDASAEDLQRAIALHARAVVLGRERAFAHVMIALQITRDCDCMESPGPPLFPDIGLLASTDPVALDQATLDLVESHTGKPLRWWTYPEIDPTHQLAHGQVLGLGTRSYRLVTLP